MSYCKQPHPLHHLENQNHLHHWNRCCPLGEFTSDKYKIQFKVSFKIRTGDITQQSLQYPSTLPQQGAPKHPKNCLQRSHHNAIRPAQESWLSSHHHHPSVPGQALRFGQGWLGNYGNSGMKETPILFYKYVSGVFPFDTGLKTSLASLAVNPSSK